MSYKIVALDRFSQDLTSTLNYLEKVTHAPQASRKLSHAVREQLAILSSFPYSCPVDAELTTDTGYEVRKCIIQSYKLFYMVKEAEREVHLFALTHARQNTRYIRPNAQ